MTARLDKMEAAGTVRRLPDPDDRRGIVIELTDEGHALWQEVIDIEIEKESLVAATLTPAEREELNALLRRLVVAFDELHERPSKP
jgi:DNA-binding MarR family transcriptional regulator